MRLDRCYNIADLRRLAKRRAHKMVFDYIDGGADDENTLRRNSESFDNYDILHRVLTGVDNIDTSTTLLGETIAVPFIGSPAAGNRLFHTEGEAAVSKAFSDLDTIYCLSTLSSVSLEDIADASTGPKWFQLYVWKDRGLVKEMLDRARGAGYKALVLTVDFPVTGNREKEYRNNFTIPPKVTAKQVWEAVKAPAWSWDYVTKPTIRYANLSEETAATSLASFVAQQLSAGFNWKDAEWFLGEWNGPSVIKGVVHSDDAKRSEQTGFDAIMVSNHGGRQLDASPPPISVLADVVESVSEHIEVILDGGVRRGTDVLKALALGARAVSFARPYLYGLAAAGGPGVRRGLALMKDAVRRDMALAGVSSIRELDTDILRQRGH